MRIKSFDNTRIFYTKSGKGKAILFIHGIGCNSTIWKPFLDYFRKSNKVIAVDLRNFGKSSNGSVSYDAFVDDIIAVIDKEKIRPAIIGHCVGAGIAAEISRKRKVDKIVMTNPFVAGAVRYKLVLSFFSGFLLNLIGLFAPRKKRFQDYSRHRNRHSGLWPFIDLRGCRVKDYAKAVKEAAFRKVDINVPALTIVSGKDLLVDNSAFRRMARKHRIIEIKDADHLAIIKNPGKVLKIVEDYIG